MLNEVQVDSYRLDITAFQFIFSSGERVRLSKRETEFLAFLMRAPEQIIASEMILEQVWGYDTGDRSTLTTLVHRLRQKIEVDPRHPQLIQHMGEGYGFFS